MHGCIYLVYLLGVLLVPNDVQTLQWLVHRRANTPVINANKRANMSILVPVNRAKRKRFFGILAKMVILYGISKKKKSA